MREAQTAFPLFRFPFNGASLFLPFSLFTVSFQRRQPFFYLFPFLPFPFNGASPFFTFFPFYRFLSTAPALFYLFTLLPFYL